MTTSPLHVAIDVGPLYGHRTGIGLAVAELAAALTARDDLEIEPYLVSFRATPQAGHRRLPIPGFLASHVWSRADRPSADRWLAGVDLVHGTNYVAPPTSLPTVVSVYDCWTLEHPEQATRVVRRAGARLRRSVARGAWVHASSTATAERVRALLGTDRVVAIPLGPPPPPPPLETLDRPAVAADLRGAPFVLSIGTEERRKDLPRLVAAMAQVATRHPDVHLVIAGASGDATADITAAIDATTSDVSDRIHRLGAVDDSSKHWLLRQAAVLAYPSLDEGFGFPVLEAQLAGTPVVASRVGAIPEMAGDGAVLVDDTGPTAFADAIEDVLQSGVRRLGLLEAGHRNAARFSWSRTAESLAGLYASVVEDTA